MPRARVRDVERGPRAGARAVSRPLLDRDYEALGALLAASQLAPSPGAWFRPMDIGGSSGSHHSPTLRKLERRGLVEQKARTAGGRKFGRLYRITAAGTTALVVTGGDTRPASAVPDGARVAT